MNKKQEIKLFEEQKVRMEWDDEKEKWFFSIVDVCGVLTDSKDYLTARKYWNKLKQRLKEEGNETVTNCHQLKMKAADGKMRLTDVADMEQMFRVIQSIPSPKAEPFKQWMAKVASQRVDQMQDPELNFEQAYADYRRLGYSDRWINQRLKSIFFLFSWNFPNYFLSLPQFHAESHFQVLADGWDDMLKMVFTSN